MIPALLQVQRCGAIAAAVGFYDTMCSNHSERSARAAAELYMRRKVPCLDEDIAAALLAGALAGRADVRAKLLAEPCPYCAVDPSHSVICGGVPI